jgi:hypothetical protein
VKGLMVWASVLALFQSRLHPNNHSRHRRFEFNIKLQGNFSK